VFGKPARESLLSLRICDLVFDITQFHCMLVGQNKVWFNPLFLLWSVQSMPWLILLHDILCTLRICVIQLDICVGVLLPCSCYVHELFVEMPNWDWCFAYNINSVFNSDVWILWCLAIKFSYLLFQLYNQREKFEAQYLTHLMACMHEVYCLQKF
jgi:hypothetical protein